MHLHEYQSKRILSDYAVPVPRGGLVTALSQVEAVAAEVGDNAWVVKAQVHAGARGKAGGVRRVEDWADLRQAATALLGQRLITAQTGAEGLPVNALWLERPTEIARELYFGLLVDRSQHRVVIMAGGQGGVDIEQTATSTGQPILIEHIHPAEGLLPFQSRKIGFKLGLDWPQVQVFAKLLDKLYRVFTENDASLLEINPLVITPAGDFVVLDVKMDLDDNALYRQRELALLRDVAQEDPSEAQARAQSLNYIRLDGNIACMVNGAGLAMATMDLIQHHGGRPANFLDVGGTATAERVAEAFKLLLADAQVRAVLINIFGGIVRCDLIAEGILGAIREVHIEVPVIVRLEGTNAEAGRQLLADSELDIITADGLTDAAQKAVLAGGEA